MILSDIITPCWPGHLPEGVLATPRGEYVFLQNTTDGYVFTQDFELNPYCTAIYKREGDALRLVYQQKEFAWSPIR